VRHEEDNKREIMRVTENVWRDRDKIRSCKGEVVSLLN